MQKVKKYITRVMLWVLALQLLNLSIYAQEFKSIAGESAKDAINITESVAEYLVEIVLGHTNAFPEQSTHHKDLHFHKHLSINAITAFQPYTLPVLVGKSALVNTPLRINYCSSYILEINPPPPKA